MEFMHQGCSGCTFILVNLGACIGSSYLYFEAFNRILSCQSLFQLISSIDRHKPCAEHPIKFISRRRPNTLKFKINPGMQAFPLGYLYQPVEKS